MSEKEQIIVEVNSSMAMEGLPLTSEDVERISLCLDAPERFEELLAALVSKHTAI